MKTLRKVTRFMVMAIMVAVILSLAVPETKSNAEENYNEVADFVERMYQVCLQRQPDKAGLESWTNKLKAGEITGADCTYGFFFSNEFQAMNLCDECFIRSLYNVYLDRNPDAQGMANWKEALAGGATRGSLLTGFIESAEFTSICEYYGIKRGNGQWNDQRMVITGNCAKCGAENKTVTDLVKRLYYTCLDRSPDKKGLADWVERLKNGESGANVAYGFIFSNEFQKKGFCNEHFVEYMYRVFFDRNSDLTGKAGWTAQLNAGATKGMIFSGFVGSQEFLKLCSRYGILAGAQDYSASDYKSGTECMECSIERDSSVHIHTWVVNEKLVYHEEDDHYEIIRDGEVCLYCGETR